MIDKLKSFMKKKYNHNLVEFKVCSAEKQKSKFMLFPVYLYTVFLIGYAIQALGLIADIYNNIVIVFVVGVLLGMYQIVLIKNNKPESLVITPEHLIKCFGKKTFVVLKFDDIKKFKVSKEEGIVVSDRKNEISISPTVYKEDLGIIVEILEAKGKTFDRSRDFMKRPIIVTIKNNQVMVKDVEQEESTTEKLVGEFYKDFKMLTPGFINDIIFLNSVVDDTFMIDNNLVMNLDSFEVKEGHPENTGFEAITANDCIAIFENVKIKSMSIKKARVRDAKEEVLPNELALLTSNIEKGVIANWKYRKNGIELHFAIGTDILRVSFDYNEAIIGWNTIK